MKYILITLGLFVIMSCTAQQKSASAEVSSIEYLAQTRGYELKIEANSKIVSFLEKGEAHKNALTSIKTADWEEFQTLIGELDLKNIDKLKAPTQGSHVDRAAMASINIIIGNTEYRSITFDHGNPPAELVALTNKLLSFAK